MTVLKWLTGHKFSPFDAFWMMFIGHVVYSGHPFLGMGLGAVCAVISVVLEMIVKRFSRRSA